jgi:hypothetical protein
MSDSENVIVKYSSYTEAQKRATQKYRSNNKDKVNEQRKKYYLQRKESDPNFLEYKRAKAREYYQKKKQQAQEMNEQIIEALEQNTPEATNEPEGSWTKAFQEDAEIQEDGEFKAFQEAVLNPPVIEPEPTPEPDDLPIETVEVAPKKKRASRKKKTVDV